METITNNCSFSELYTKDSSMSPPDILPEGANKWGLSVNEQQKRVAQVKTKFGETWLLSNPVASNKIESKFQFSTSIRPIYLAQGAY